MDAKSAEIERCQKELEERQPTVATQLATNNELSAKSPANQKLEQQNRELHNCSENMKEEVAAMKLRVKTLQNDLAAEREQVKALKPFDPVKMKKSLDDNKKRLAEKTSAAEALQKSLGKTKGEMAELELKVKNWKPSWLRWRPVVEEAEAEAAAVAQEI